MRALPILPYWIVGRDGRYFSAPKVVNFFWTAFLKSSAIIAAGKAIRKRTAGRESESAKEGGKTRPAEMVVKTMVQEKGKTTRASPQERGRTKGKEKAKIRAKGRRKERVLDLQAVMEAAPPLLETRAELCNSP